MVKAMPDKIAICICTYKRPEGLRRLMESLETLQGGFEYTLFVADNDAARHEGFDFIQAHRKQFSYPIVCEMEAGIGISRARNKTLAMAKESGISFDYVAFTDDDVEASPLWLRDMVAASKLYDADVVEGKLEPIFEGNPTLEMLSSGFFLENFRTGPTGELLNSAGTNNLLVRFSVFEKEGFKVFDEHLSTCGGEDEGFTMGLFKKGYKLIKCAAGTCYETFPAARVSLEWTFKRTYRSGSTYAYNYRKHYGLVRYGIMVVKKLILLPFRYAMHLVKPSLDSKAVLLNNLGFFHYVVRGTPYEEYKRSV